MGKILDKAQEIWLTDATEPKNPRDVHDKHLYRICYEYRQPRHHSDGWCWLLWIWLRDGDSSQGSRYYTILQCRSDPLWKRRETIHTLIFYMMVLKWAQPPPKSNRLIFHGVPKLDDRVKNGQKMTKNGFFRWFLAIIANFEAIWDSGYVILCYLCTKTLLILQKWPFS